jgi:predicted  nucleic acid-binding Zn-ribbon protein
MTTAAWIINLKRLQEKDLRIRDLRLRLEMIPKEQLELKNRAGANLAKIEQAKNDVIALQMKLKKTEKIIADCKENIKKLETQSVMVKKNNEYQAMMQNIENQKLKISDEEISVITLLDSIEEGKKNYKVIAENVKFENASLKAEFKDLEKLAADIQTELESLKKERTALTAPVEDEILRRYENLLSRGTGVPLAAVRDGICDNCHLKVTPQTVNQAVKHAVVFCDNCQHFLYTED